MRVKYQTVLAVFLMSLVLSNCSPGTPDVGHAGLSANEKRLRAEAGFAMAVSSFTNTLLADVYKAMAEATAATAPRFETFAKKPTSVTISIDTTPGLNVITRGKVSFLKTESTAAATRFDVALAVHSTWINGFFPYGNENLTSAGSIDSEGEIAMIVDGHALAFSGRITEAGEFIVGVDAHQVSVEVSVTRLGASFRGTMDGVSISGDFDVINKVPSISGQDDAADDEVLTPPAIIACTFASGPRFGQCWDYIGEAAATAFHNLCYANDGTEAVSACSQANRLGTCTTGAGSTNERKIRYSILSWGDSTASLNCTSAESGVWVAD